MWSSLTRGGQRQAESSPRLRWRRRGLPGAVPGSQAVAVPADWQGMYSCPLRARMYSPTALACTSDGVEPADVGDSLCLKSQAFYRTRDRGDVDGSLTVTPTHIQFVPDPRGLSDADGGIGEFQVFLEYRAILECGAIVVPREDREPSSPPARYLLQCALRTPERKPQPPMVVF